MAQRDIFMSPWAFCDEAARLETLQPSAHDALRDDGDYVCIIDHILGHFRRRHLSGHQGMVQ
jgi:hypothetical protein